MVALVASLVVAPGFVLAKASVLEYAVCRWWGPGQVGGGHPLAVAHRGYLATDTSASPGNVIDYPVAGRWYLPDDTVCENSAASIEAALAAGFSAIEVDVSFTRDRVPILFHDRTLERLTGQKGAVEESTWGELQRIRLADGQEILSLADFWRTYAGRFDWVCIDVKSSDDYAAERARALSAAMPTRPQMPRTLVVGVGYRLLRETAKLRGDFGYACEVFGVLASRLAGFDSISASLDKFSPGQTRLARSLGLTYVVWVVNTPEQLALAQRAGVDAYITDRAPALLPQGRRTGH